MDMGRITRKKTYRLVRTYKLTEDIFYSIIIKKTKDGEHTLYEVGFDCNEFVIKYEVDFISDGFSYRIHYEGTYGRFVDLKSFQECKSFLTELIKIEIVACQRICEIKMQKKRIIKDFLQQQEK